MKEKKNLIKDGIIIIIILILIIEMFPVEIDCEKNESQFMTEYKCIKTSLDNFESCIDIGFESTGFISGEHYYLCNNTKIAYNCLEYKGIPSNKSFMGIIQCKKENSKQ